MDTAPPPEHRPQLGAERQRQIGREAEDIAKADVDVEAGRLVDSADVKAWIDSIGSDRQRPVPYAGR